MTPEHWMKEAIRLSKRGYPAPNPHVGCVLVRNGAVVGRGYHAYAGGPHAEVVALQQAQDAAKGATAYVTLEPCNHFGRTPPCTEALLAAGVKKVVIAVPDPNPIASGGAARLQDQGIQVEEGLLEDEARQANHIWLTAQALQRPYVVLKAGISLDGRIALPSGKSQWITGEPARRQAHRLRAELGAVLVGTNTVLQDDPLLTSRIPGVRRQPERFVVDFHHRVPPGKRVFGLEAKTYRLTQTASGPEDLEVESRDPAAYLKAVWSEGTTSILLEGGATLTGAFLEAGLVDRMELFLAPKVLGSGPSWAEAPNLPESVLHANNWRVARTRKLGEDLQLTLLPAKP